MSKRPATQFLELMFQDIFSAKAAAEAQAKKEEPNPSAPPFDLDKMCWDARSRIDTCIERETQLVQSLVLGGPLIATKPGYPQYTRLSSFQTGIEQRLGTAPSVIVGRNLGDTFNSSNAYIDGVPLADLVATHNRLKNLIPVKVGPIRVLVTKEAVDRCRTSALSIKKAAHWMVNP